MSDPTNSGDKPTETPVIQRRGHAGTGADAPTAEQPPAQPPPHGGGPGGGPGGGTGGPWQPADGAPRENLVHDGKFGEIFVLFLINLLLTLITLGIYRFWGKTRIRKYVWSHTSLRGERFEYAGTGLELFVGFLFAVVILGAPTAAIYIWLFADPPTDPERILTIVGLFYLVLALLFFMYYVAIFAAYRYRISRTAWFGIRGGMEGSAWTYGFLGFGLGLLNGISLGWTKPWADSVVFRYRLSRTWFGSAQFASKMDCGQMYGPFAFAWVGTLIVGAISFGLFFGLVLVDVMRSARAGDPIDQAGFQIWMVLAYVVPVLVYQLLIPWYKASLVRSIANTLSVQDIRFSCGITGRQMFALVIPNFLMLIFTFGLAYPYVILRTARYTAKHLTVIGDIETARIRQTEVSGPWYGEGIMEFLGVGMI